MWLLLTFSDWSGYLHCRYHDVYCCHLLHNSCEYCYLRKIVLKIYLSFRLSQVCELQFCIFFGSYNIQENSFNPTSNKSEILIVRRLRRVVPRPEVRLFIRKKLHQWKRQASRTWSKHPSKVSVHQLSRPLVFYFIKFFRCENTRKHRRTSKWPLTLNQQMEVFSIRMDTPLIIFLPQV